MPESDQPQEFMNLSTVDSEIVKCEARIDELKARLKVLRKAKKKLESGLHEDAALGGRTEEGMNGTADDSRLGGNMGQGSTL